MPVFPQVGGMELLILLIIILLFFGSKRVPEVGRSLGKGMRELRKGASGAPDEAEKLDEQNENEGLSSQEEARSAASKEDSPREEESTSRAEAPTTDSANGRGSS